MPVYVGTDKCDGCRVQGRTARMYSFPHDLWLISVRPLS